MPVLRDIVAKLSLDLDKKSFKEADKSIAGLTKRFAGLEGKIALAAMAFGAFKLTEFASDAQETMNVLEASFEDNTETVKKWAAELADDAGRSEFQLREMAGILGAVLNPMMDRNADEAAKMSARFAELAVDLGSFFNAADIDALQALRSGIVGEAEPLKRFGVVMNIATLEAFALSKGIRKNVKDMTNAEKTALRYNFILEQTKLAHGDAARTSTGWANATKGLISGIKDVATRAGQVLLPIAEKIVAIARGATRSFAAWAKESNILKAALIVLGAVAAMIFKSIVIAALPVLIPMAKLIAVMVVATLVLNDLLNMFEGGESVIGNFIDALFGPGSAAEAVDNLKMAWEGFVLFWENETLPAWQSIISIFGKTIADLKQWFKDLFTTVRGWIVAFMGKFGGLVDFIQKKAKAIADFLGFEFEFKKVKQEKEQDEDEHFERQDYKRRQKEHKKRVKDLQARIAKEKDAEKAEALKKLKKQTLAEKAAEDSKVAAGKKRRKSQSRQRTADLKREIREQYQLMEREAQAAQRYVVNIQFAGQRPTLAQPFAQAGGPTTINQTVAVNVAGMREAAEARKIAETASKSVRNENRKTLAALTQRAG